MRSWLFKPLIFYPLLLLAAALLALVSLSPLSWSHAQGPVSGQIRNGVLVLRGEALGAPASDTAQEVRVMRDFFGATQALRVAAKPKLPAPTAQDRGVQILLGRQPAQFLESKPVVLRIDYRPIPLSTASALAVNLEGGRLQNWVSQPVAPEGGSVSFALPAQTAVSAIGLRTIHDDDERNYGVEIVRISVTPSAS
jgi:hypothetical protein